MKISRSFSAPISEGIANQRAIDFLTQAGYTQLLDSDGSLHFYRGSIVGTLSSFNPTRWACAVNVRVKSKESLSEINVEAKITNDPFENRFAKELLTAELSRLEGAVTKNEIIPFDVGYLRKRIASYVYQIVGLFTGLFISLFLGLNTVILAPDIIRISPSAASAIGAGVSLILVTICLLVWRRQTKR